ncbi:hypothetical protein [Paraburkholderia kururiensis]|uniref:Uncharacterized protein n=1 Tax=Paraburkholderia kururiensis TaxID=984307 RepID=A0ABZ0WRY5_9BURK|nr:hypothetical protein [Paraburkholderia kururiensis]WQD80154.1 hypothetical protein U0042_10970 [Paraburkholderia kururiensis]
MTVHHFDIEDAGQHGLVGAILLYNLRFWILHNRANDRHLHAGRTWTFNSAKAFAALFPYLSEDQIQRALKKLVESGVLMRRVGTEDRWDRTNWYAFVDEGKYLAGSREPVAADSAKLRNASRDIAASIPQDRAVDPAESRNLCTDVNADKKRRSASHEAPTRPDWFVEEQTAGDSSVPIDSSAAAKLAIALRAAGINCAVAHPKIQMLAEQGVSVETAVAAAEYATAAKEGEKVSLGYVVKVLESWAKSASTPTVAGAKAPAAKAKYGAWWLSDSTALSVANQVGVGSARAHESREAWHARISAAIDNGGTPSAPRAEPTPIPVQTPLDVSRTGASDASRVAIASVRDLLKTRVLGARA